ncbi:MAG: glycosyltransferase family 2 protein [Armatimonadetes bacterium]|nr:glycosyltransferase family 2 protein [Armatimonadota bacterium]
MKASVVVPVYNEAANLPVLYQRLAQVLGELGLDWELILVNDCSRDDSWQVIRDLHARDARVKGLSLSRNFGQQSAIAAGLRHATGDVVVVMDADLQDPPELVPELLRKLSEGHDVAYAIKRSRREPLLRGILFGLFYAIQTRLAEPKMPAGAGTFCAMTRRVVDVLNRMGEHSRYLSGLRAYAGFQQVGVEFDRPERHSGKPQQSFGKLLRMGLDAIFAYSYIPARLASILGLATAAVALGVTIWVLYGKLVAGTAILGWASTMVSHLFIGAVQLICIGILGEYVARIYEEVRRRPLYIVAEAVGLTSEENAFPNSEGRTLTNPEGSTFPGH